MQNSHSPPYPKLFQGPYYNRRLRMTMPRRRKPLISKLPGTPTWVCRIPALNEGVYPVHGFGHTPKAAYEEWRRSASAVPF
jgi:hypothetical protein